MTLWELIKRIPTPEYGNYGGYYNRKDHDKDGKYPEPVDPMDSLFFEHDMGMLKNDGLVRALEGIKDSELKYKIYGFLYRRSAWLVFKIAVAFGAN